MKLIVNQTEGTLVLGSSFGRLDLAQSATSPPNFCFTTPGKIRYSADGWALAMVDNDIARYYTALIERRFGIKLMTFNKSGAHVSIIRGERPLQNADRWHHLSGVKVDISYAHQLYTNGRHWWLAARSPDANELRSFYGLSPWRGTFHLTIGRTF